MSVEGIKDFYNKTLSPFWKLWKDEEFLDMTSTLFSTAASELLEYTKHIARGVSVDTADKDGPIRWEPLRLGIEEGKPLDYQLGSDLEINKFFIGGSPNPGKNFWEIPEGLLFEGVASRPIESWVSSAFERVGDKIHVSNEFLSQCVMEPAVIDNKLTTVRVVWAYKTQKAYKGQLMLRHSRFAGEVMDAREEVEDAVRAARTAWTQGLTDSSFSKLMDAACENWEILSGEPEVEDVPYIALSPGMLGPGFKGFLTFSNQWEEKEVLGGAYIFNIEGHPDDITLYRDNMSDSGLALSADWPYNKMNPAWWVLRDTGLVVISLQGVKWPEMIKVALDTLPLGRPVIFQVEGESSSEEPSFIEGSIDPVAFGDVGGSIGSPELVNLQARRTVFI